jgi:hypothetical protein
MKTGKKRPIIFHKKRFQLFGKKAHPHSPADPGTFLLSFFDFIVSSDFSQRIILSEAS